MISRWKFKFGHWLSLLSLCHMTDIVISLGLKSRGMMAGVLSGWFLTSECASIFGLPESLFSALQITPQSLNFLSGYLDMSLVRVYRILWCCSELEEVLVLETGTICLFSSLQK